MLSNDPDVQAQIEKNAKFYESGEAIDIWEAIKQRHRARDEQFLRTLLPYFRPGPVLELGAATGNLAAVLQSWGHDVKASDFSQAFVDHMSSIGLDAVQIDVTDPIAPAHGTWPMMIAQGVSPMCMRDKALNIQVLRNVHEALEPGGRVLCIFGIKRDDHNRAVFHQPDEQMRIAEESGLFRVVMSRPHQVLPPALYRGWNAAILNRLDFGLSRIRSIRHVWVLEKV